MSLRENFPNTELLLVRIFLYSDSVNLRIQSENRKIQTRKNSVFGHFSRSEWFNFSLSQKIEIYKKISDFET